MPLKSFNPTTPSQRNLVLVDKSALHKGGPVKKLTEGLPSRVAETILVISLRGSAGWP